MAKKAIKITIAEGVHQDLKRLAESQGDEVASRAAYYIQRAIDEAREKGEIPSAETNTLPEDQFGDRAKQFLRVLFLGDSIDLIDLAKLANDLGIETERLHELIKTSKSKGRIKNGH